MQTEDSPAQVGSNDGLGLSPERVTPRAWAIFVGNGNVRLWSTLQPHVQELADAEGLEVAPLYDKAALDATVAAERERCAKVCEEVATWAGSTWRKAGLDCAEWVRKEPNVGVEPHSAAGKDLE